MPEMTEPSTLATFWAVVIAASILIYVLLDGFDLGVGILFGTARDEGLRQRMMASIAPFWDGNETWLVVIGASLFAAFPAVYAVFLGAFYLPVLLMLFGLIFRGVAFEFRERSEARMRRVWDRGFFWGSVLVTFVQGAAVGALMRGIAVKDFQFDGGPLDWLHPFAVLTGIGLVFGHALLGAGWLVLKSDGALRDWARVRIRPLSLAVGATLVPAALASVTIDFSPGLAAAASRLSGTALIFPAVGLIALAGVAASAHRGPDWVPFVLTASFITAAFLTLGSLMWPYMIPYTLTVADAAAPDSSLRFFFYGGVFVLPVIILYTVCVYWIFRGKLTEGHPGYGAVRPPRD